ncbi:MAG: hypothetical protein OEV42_11210 [Deltaproteobacteria bacterium]|nr:hypothetical protein [Deltaproteobacteria bacterium]
MLFLLPGMGANHKMYSEYEPWNSLEETTFLDWPAYDGEKSLRNMAERIVREHGIKVEDSIGGSSLGGMVALEIYKILGNRKVVLIGSAVNKSEINPLLRTLSPLAEITPLKLIQVFTGKYDSNLSNMFTEADSEFIKSMCFAINDWQGYEGDQQDIIRIHGKKDMIIKCPEKCFEIADGGHLITMAHAGECVKYLANVKWV